MPRSFSTDFRNALEASASDEVLLAFLTLTHPDLIEPVRVVCDVVDYLYGDELFTGIPFELVLLSDDDRPPRGTLRIQNVDGIVGRLAQQLRSSPRVTIELLARSDFDDAVPREPLGTPTVELMINHGRLTNIVGNAMDVQADIVSFDLTQEPWPCVRTTKEECPALYFF